MDKQLAHYDAKTKILEIPMISGITGMTISINFDCGPGVDVTALEMAKRWNAGALKEMLDDRT
jgi:methionyl-tRNA formyltransferase